MAADEPRDHAALGRSWDAILDRPPEASAAADPVLAETIGRLHRLDRGFAATPAFLDRLEEDLMDDVAPGRSTRREATPSDPGPAALLPVPGPAPRPRRIDRPRRGPAELATAAVLLLTLGLGIAAYRLAPPPDSPDRASLPARNGPASSPSAASIGTAAPPLDVACTVAPRTVEEIVALYGPPTPIPTPGEPIPTMSFVTSEPTPYVPVTTLPPGRPADPATVAAVTETWRHWFACERSWGNQLRAAALVTDDGFRRIYGSSLAIFLNPPSYDDATAPATVPTAGNPTFAPTLAPTDPDPPVYTGPEPPTEARVLADGRVGALLETPMGEPDPEGRNYVVFAKVDDRWLIDEIVRTPAG